MTTRKRLDLLAGTYPRFFPRAQLLRLLKNQLGHIDALDTWIKRRNVQVRARAPRLIYHICAGNLSVSACTSLTHGLLLGSHNILKLPSDRVDSSARREILKFIRGLPAPLRKLIETQRELDPAILSQANAVIAFGSDTTMESLRAKVCWNQKFIAHGHALSLHWLSDPNHLSSRQAGAIVTDVLTYDQLGCLSSQALYIPPRTDIEILGKKLVTALESHWQKLTPKPARPLSVAARIAEARDVAHALGHRIWLPPKKHQGWTLIHDPDPIFKSSPLHGVIYLRQVSESTLDAALASVSGRISTVGVTEKISARLEKVFLDLGVSRFCPAGRMQFPPLTWHHDGQSTLADLVTWVDAEEIA